MNNNFCPIPWVSVGVRNDGILRICCHANQGPDRGELHWDVDDIDGSRNSQVMKDVRLAILAGEWHPECIRCKKESRAGIRSRNKYELEQWGNLVNINTASDKTKPDGGIDPNDFPLIYYDLRLGNLCNLKCRYCSQYSSSAFGTPPGDFNWFQRDALWEHLRSNISNIKVFHVEGGEPLLVLKHFDFLEECIKNGYAHNIVVEYTTSLNIVPSRAWDIWSKFKSIRIGTSMDGIEDVFNYIRYPSRWESILENLTKLDNIEGNFILWITCTMSTLNIWYLPDFFKWKIKRRFNRIGKRPGLPYCSNHPIHRPQIFNIKSLPLKVKDKVRDHLLDSFSEIDKVADEFESDEEMRKGYKEGARDIFNSYINYMYQEDLSNVFPKFWEYNNKLDQERGQKLSEMMPEWYEILKDNSNDS